jgi:Zn-dependent metalloprotease
MRLDSTVHYGTGYANAMWNGRQMIYGDGDGRLFRRFTASLDVIAHELMHGVTQHVVGLDYAGEPGALNEHLSDVFGVLVRQYAEKKSAAKADWLVGGDLYTRRVHGDAIRSMKAPGTAYDDPLLGRDPQPAHMRDYVRTEFDNGGVHINSGIPNHAFYRAATAIGGNAWEVTGKIWYRAISSRLRHDSTFAEFASATRAVAAEMCGRESTEHDAVITAWEAVGVDARPAARKPKRVTRPAQANVDSI